MKGTEHFKRTIQNYLEQRAETDVLFSLQYSKPHKNLDDCITYILNTVKQSGCNGFSDDEIFSMAVHFYDEDNIDIGKSIDCKVTVNHVVELSEEEKEQAKKDALQRIQNEAYFQMKQPKRKTITPTETQAQLNLF